MRLSTERILTTHTGSLPRPAALTAELERRDRGEPTDPDLDTAIRDAVTEAVRRQTAAGIDVVNDGEQSKISYATYVKERLDGFGGEGERPGVHPDADAFPEYVASMSGGPSPRIPACVGPVSYRDPGAVRADIANLKAAADKKVTETFLTAASPGVIAALLPNEHYPSEEDYLGALADAMKTEYDEIHAAGVLLQLDCPDLASSRHRRGESLEEFRHQVALHIEALNYATRDIPPEAMRLHLCWGNSEAPHHRDVPLADVIDLVLPARPAGLSFEGANPRHEHEWALFSEVRLPEGKVLLPGVLDSTTNYVEHPELVAQRIIRYADLVGRENVLASSDCGFATYAIAPTVHPTVTWAKLRAMADGARIASATLWRNPVAMAGGTGRPAKGQW